MFYYGSTEVEGWFYTPTFSVYQRVNKDVYVYVSKAIGFYMVQLYERGTASFCTLEARSENNVEALFKLGEEWLIRHKNWDSQAISMDKHYIGQKEWRENCWI